MSNETVLTEDDEGKRVVNSHGDDVGRVVEVRQGTAHVDPDPGITDTLMSKLGWGDGQDEDTYRLDSSSIETVTDDEIRLAL
jgi:sporulation protein YlmC with PRC-barrel domain